MNLAAGLSSVFLRTQQMMPPITRYLSIGLKSGMLCHSVQIRNRFRKIIAAYMFTYHVQALHRDDMPLAP